MLAWSPLLIQKIEIHALGFVLRKLQLNRHRDAEVAPHGHDFAQLILYLTGEGVQTVNGRRRRARAGDLFVIPAKAPHGFSVAGRSRPLCLVLDYELEDAGRVRAAHRTLSPATLNELHALLARVPHKGRLTLGDYPAILAVVARLLEHSPVETAPAPTLFEKLREQVATSASLGKIARDLGYHPDHLNRKLKRESGIGLRALRDRVRLAGAQAALRTEPSVAEAATRAGFEDPNYFARWFRRQTDRTPGAWQRESRRSR
ncbi:MAG: helix-turn-helix domain-containing protein [Opitutus sp.]|nr:helix-turn-helix domain-containing protein [Opitutus sp.]